MLLTPLTLAPLMRRTQKESRYLARPCLAWPGLAPGSSSPNMPGMGMGRLLDQTGPSPPPSTTIPPP